MENRVIQHELAKKLTVLLTLKGRHEYSLRWLWFFLKTNIQFKLFIADGSDDDRVKVVLNALGVSDVDFIEYHKYRDHSLESYYYKVHDALCKIYTPYVMLVDNDDFLINSGILKSLEFLESNYDFVSCGGAIGGFSLGVDKVGLPRVIGKATSVSIRYVNNDWYRNRDIDDESPFLRVKSDLTNMHPTPYSIYRTAVRRKLAEEVLKLKPSLRLVEIYNGARALSIGKVKSTPEFFTYFRQQGSSQRLGYSEDLISDIFFNRYVEDIKKMCGILASACSGNNREGGEAVESIFLYEHVQSVRVQLSNTVLRYRFPRLYSIKSTLTKIKSALSLPFISRALSVFKFFVYLRKDCRDGALRRRQVGEFLFILKLLNSTELSNFLDRNKRHCNDERASHNKL